MLTNIRENLGLKYLNDSKGFNDYSNQMDFSYKNIEEHNPNKKLIVLDDTIAHMLFNNKLNLIATTLFIRGRKPIMSFVFITKSYFSEPKNISLNSTHYFIIKIPKKWQFHQIAFNPSADMNFRDFMSIYKKSCMLIFSD